jgi:hypothetical protein
MPSAPARRSSNYASRLAKPRARKPDARPSGYGNDRNPQPPGGFSFGTNTIGGPAFVDPYGARRAPSPWQLVENFSGISYAMVARKADGVAKIPLRLMCDGSRKILGGKPRSCSDPIKVTRRTAIGHARAGKVSPSAVDEVYEIRNHPFLDVLDCPDPSRIFTRRKLLWILSAYQDVVGHGFLIPEGNGWDWKDEDQDRKKGPPEFLWLIYPQFTIPFREARSVIPRAWQYFESYIPFRAAIWFRHSISLRDAYASPYSPLYAADMYRQQEAEFIATYNQVLAMGPRPNVVASAKDPLMPPGEAERRRLEQDFVRRHAAGNSGGIWVNTGAWDFTPISYSPADMAGKELAEYDRTNMATILGVPPTYFTTETNLANLEAADEYFARFAVEPMCFTIAETLTQIVQEWDKRLYFQFDPVLVEDELKQAQTDKIYVDMGAVTLNELNEEKKYTPKKWGDEPWLPGTLVQPSMAQQKHDLAIESGKKGMEQQDAAIESQKANDAFNMQVPAPDGWDDGSGSGSSSGDAGGDPGDDQDPAERALAEREAAWQALTRTLSGTAA